MSYRISATTAAPLAAGRSINILVGKASWTDPSLIAFRRFYPRGCHTAQARLRHYARTFPFVEVDSAYYSVPDPSTAANWVLRTPDAFVFNTKAFRAFTGHWTTRNVLHTDIQRALPASSKSKLYTEDFPGEVLEELWRRYLLAIEPLKASGKLGAVHFQFAPWVQNNPDGQAMVRRSAERMTGFPVAAELAQLVPQIRAVAKRVRRTQVIFDNNTQDQGQRNALTRMDLLGL